MKRQEFIDTLRERLSKLPKEELDSALDYYNEIFLDAGEENEENAAEELGSIDVIARQLYVENGIDPDGDPAYFIEKYNGPKAQQGQQFGQTQQNFNNGPQPGPYMQNGPFPQQGYPYMQQPAQKGKLKVGSIIAMVLLFPLWFPLLIVSMVLMFVLTIVLFSIELVFIAGGISCAIGGLISIPSIPPAGLVFMGGGLVMIGIFLLTVKYVAKACGRIFLGFFGALTDFGQKIFMEV